MPEIAAHERTEEGHTYTVAAHHRLHYYTEYVDHFNHHPEEAREWLRDFNYQDALPLAPQRAAFKVLVEREAKLSELLILFRELLGQLP